jgi:UDP-2,3-diacylglucosamine pyrophosphatase LpxH
VNIITADLHLTDRGQDLYRFGIFPWLEDVAKKNKAEKLFILGDLTDQKDRHSSRLVNMIMDNLYSLSRMLRVFILKGNHDFTDPNLPFFKFISKVDSLHFINEPTSVDEMLLLPHTKDFSGWKELALAKGSTYVGMHQTIDGAVVSNGKVLPGLSTTTFRGTKVKRVYSGDIHVPQDIGMFTHVGSPYSIRFDDDFEPRAILLNPKNGDDFDFFFDRCLRKWKLHIRDVYEIQNNQNLRRGDQVKIEIELTREELVNWPTYRQKAIEECRKLGVGVFGVKLVTQKKKKRVRLNGNGSGSEGKLSSNPEEIINEFCIREKVGDDFREAGLTYLDCGG